MRPGRTGLLLETVDRGGHLAPALHGPWPPAPDQLQDWASDSYWEGGTGLELGVTPGRAQALALPLTCCGSLGWLFSLSELPRAHL